MDKQLKDNFDSIEDFDKIERSLEFKIGIAELRKTYKELKAENIELRKRYKKEKMTSELKLTIINHFKAYISLGEKNKRFFEECKKDFPMIDVKKEMEIYQKKFESLKKELAVHESNNQ